MVRIEDGSPISNRPLLYLEPLTAVRARSG